jgi:predicted metal-binding protein
VVCYERIEEILAGRAHEQGVVPVSALVFSPDLLAYCVSNVCGHYNTSWTCPPASGSIEEQQKKILSWQSAFIFTTKHDLEDSFDYEGMTRARELHTELTLELREKLGTAPVYGAGSCPCCRHLADAAGIDRSCAFPAPCRFPDRKISSIEAAGINVTELSKTAGIRYNNGPNTVTYFSMVLYKDH